MSEPFPLSNNNPSLKALLRTQGGILLKGDLKKLMPALIGKTMEFLEQEAVKKDKAGNKLSAQALLDVKYPIKGLLISFWKAIEMRQAEGEKMLE